MTAYTPSWIPREVLHAIADATLHVPEMDCESLDISPEELLEVIQWFRERIHTDIENI